MFKFIRTLLLFACFNILVSPYTTRAFAQPDPGKVLIGTWEGRFEENVSGPSERTLIIRSVEPTETGWVVEGRYWVEVRVKGYAIRKGEVSLQDGLLVLEFSSPQNDSYRFILKNSNRLEGTLYYAQYRGGGVGMRTYHLILEKRARRAKE